MSIGNFELNELMTHIEESGFGFSQEQLYNLIVSLKTKPFVILSGISGTGKSKIIELISEYLNEKMDYEDNLELVAVKPNWTDSRGIFGFQNLLDDTYSITPTIKLFLRALNEPDKPFFLILDEMNLARVEHYFSDFLSLLESRRYSREFKNIVNDVQYSDEFYTELSQIFNKDITLSESIILSAIQEDDKKFKEVSHYREMPLQQWWFENYSTSKNILAQFRTEFNQGRQDSPNDPDIMTDGSRLAGKAFWSKKVGNSYKLKDEADMDDNTAKKYKEIKRYYNTALEKSEIIVHNKNVIQQKINLHNSNEILKSDQTQQDYTQTELASSNAYYSEKDGYYVPSSIEIPMNVFVVGTVNVDETTYDFSAKVLDRSNVIEFNELDLYKAYGYGPVSRTLSNSYVNQDNLDFKIIIPTSQDTKHVVSIYKQSFDIIISIFNLLKNDNRHFGYRVFNEISRYILNFCGEHANQDDLLIAIDLQILQKILPKLNGSLEDLDPLLENILDICEKHNLVRSAKKIKRMISELTTHGFTTFIK